MNPTPLCLKRPRAGLCSLAFALLPAALVPSGAHADPLEGFYFRAGVTRLAPQVQSGPVVLSNVSGAAQLAVSNGPIAGSAVGMGASTLPSLTLGYRFYDQLSVETILAPAVQITLTAKGTMATQSLAPYALGDLPTGVPPLGPNLGTATVLPPVVTLVYRFLPELPVRPYLGSGLSYLFTIDAKITNPVLTAVAPPQLSIPPRPGWVLQGGVDVKLWRNLFFTADFKYIAFLHVVATMHNVQVKVPDLPLYGSAQVGDGSVAVTVNPIVLQAGLGWNF